MDKFTPNLAVLGLIGLKTSQVSLINDNDIVTTPLPSTNHNCT